MSNLTIRHTADFNPNPFLKEGEEVHGLSLIPLDQQKGDTKDVHRRLRTATHERRYPPAS